MTSAVIHAECSALQVTCRKLFSKFSLVLKYQYRAYSTNICTPQSNRTATKKPEVRCKNICTPKLNVEQLAKTYINIQVTKIITPNNVLLLYLSFTRTNKHWPNQMLYLLRAQRSSWHNPLSTCLQKISLNVAKISQKKDFFSLLRLAVHYLK